MQRLFFLLEFSLQLKILKTSVLKIEKKVIKYNITETERDTSPEL